MGVVFVAKAHSSIVEVEQAMIADCRSMSVLSQIFENLLRTTERRFGIDHPIGLGGRCKETLKLVPRSRRGEGTWKTEPPLRERRAQAGQKLASVHSAENTNREEKLVGGTDPVAAIGRQPAARHDAVGVGV